MVVELVVVEVVDMSQREVVVEDVVIATAYIVVVQTTYLKSVGISLTPAWVNQAQSDTITPSRTMVPSSDNTSDTISVL